MNIAGIGNAVVIYKTPTKNKEVFVKHEQAPTDPKLEGVWVFLD